MNRYKNPDQAELGVVQQAYAELDAVDALLKPPSRGDGGPVMASELLAYACGEAAEAGRVKAALIRFPSMRGVLKDMVVRMSDYQMPEAIAASTKEFPERRTEGCRVRMEASRAEADQYYLIIELVESGEIPSVLTLCDAENEFEQITLPSPRRGVIQVIVTNESGIPDMLRDPKTAIYLR